MSRKLVNLEGWNKRGGDVPPNNYLNGFECPECLEELIDTNRIVKCGLGAFFLDTNCLNCDFKGSRYLPFRRW